jgi:hypothetical protein
LQDIADALPHENPEKVLETMIAWGRYAGIRLLGRVFLIVRDKAASPRFDLQGRYRVKKWQHVNPYG